MSCEPGRLRVLMLLHDLDIGGAQVGVSTLARALGAYQCRPVVCAWRRGGAIEARLRASGVPVESPQIEPAGWRRLGVASRLRAVVEQHAIDVIHAHLSDSAFWGVMLQRLTGRPCVVTHHSNDLVDTTGEARWLYGWARRRLLFACSRRAAVNIAVSASIADQLTRRTRVPAERVTVVPNGIALPADADVEPAVAARQQRAASAFAAAGPRLLFVGRLVPEKGVDIVLRAAPEVLAVFPTATFVVVGDGAQAAALREQARALGIHERTEFVGWTAAVGPWLAAADVFVSASRVEGLSVALLEAMAWGVPVVVSDIAGHRDVVRSGDTGLLTPLNAPHELAHTLIAALRDGEARLARAHRARRLVHDEYAADRLAQRHVAIYRQVLAARRG